MKRSAFLSPKPDKSLFVIDPFKTAVKLWRSLHKNNEIKRQAYLPFHITFRGCSLRQTSRFSPRIE